MIVKIYDARQSVYERERPKEGKREFIVEVKDISVNVEKLFIDGEEAGIDEKDLLLLDVNWILFVGETFDSERGIVVYKEAHINSRTFSIKEAIKEALQDIFEDTVIRTTHVE
jgi:hypothetical protein